MEISVMEISVKKTEVLNWQHRNAMAVKRFPREQLIGFYDPPLKGKVPLDTENVLSRFLLLRA